MSVILEDDQSLMEKEWINLTMAQVKRTFELRLKKRWSDKTSGKSSPTWILVSASQEKNEDGSTKSVMGCITDISLQKQAQADALERAALSEQLIIRTQEAAESEKKFKQMAELAPCGPYQLMDRASHCLQYLLTLFRNVLYLTRWHGDLGKLPM